MALVGEDEPPPIVELKKGVRVRGELSLRGKEEKSAGHAEVRDEDMRVAHIEQHVLAASGDVGESRAAERAREAARRNLRREAGADERCRHNAPPAQEAVKRARDEFNFRQFRHSQNEN